MYHLTDRPSPEDQSQSKTTLLKRTKKPATFRAQTKLVTKK